MGRSESPRGLELLRPGWSRTEEVLTPEALDFVAKLQREFRPRRDALLQKRKERQARLDAGERPDFLAQTAATREADWRVAPIPDDLKDRRVEITGPAERKMIINALNSGARVFMADFEDANSPTWTNLIDGQINLRDAVAGTISYAKPDGKEYRLNKRVATLMVRPRGWHLDEKHLLIDGRPASASLFDFGLFFFHNARTLVDRGSGPYFYLPKMESHLEARLWNDVFVMAQELLGLPRGTIRATVLIETILAGFEMDEILYELRDHSAGLNCGRWDYIFSFIKKFRRWPDFVLPDRVQVTMTTHFLRSYSQLAIQTCHRRGAHAMGGMAAQIPIKDDPSANEAAIAKVRADKERESRDGHDGTWVAHPGLVPIATEIFDANMPRPNQIDRPREDVRVTRDDLLRIPEGQITEHGLRHNIDVGIQYIESWLGGNGCVPIYNLMEDAATAEISRTQVWQWVHQDRGVLDDGRKVTAALVRSLISEELQNLRRLVGDDRYRSGRYELASQIFDQLATGDELEDFLTLAAYKHLD
jgi:malate synthase